MNTRFLIFTFLLLTFNIAAQDLPTIVPPSPNASAFHVYGNTQTNNYTGSPDISIPIWEVKEGELSVPIYLKYTGGNGIKVEEIASWVGLGWTLNAGGAISRTIRGIADEDDTRFGFFRTNGIPAPITANYSLYEQINNGNRDGEPDKFMYNYPGGSGSFFYNYDQSIYFKPKKDIKVTHNIGIEPESIAPVHCETYDDVITDFTLNDEYGNTFLFKDKERSNTITFGTSYSDTRGFPSTWYLRKMENRNKTHAIDFEYDTYGYSLKRTVSTFIKRNEIEGNIFTETSYIGKRLKKIVFSQGSVEFVASTSNRKDLSNNKYLDKIIVKDFHGKIIKTIKFSYKYMTTNTLVDLSANLPNEETTRLVLTSIQECDGNNNCNPPTIFTYATSHYLPSRFSKAQDHWGYYNGQNSNSTLEPKHIITWYNPYNPSNNKIETLEVGTANRVPDVNYAKAGILMEVKYPTGGKTVFDYESHTAINDELQGELTNVTEGVYWENTILPFTINSNASTTKVTVSGSYHDPVNQCKPKVYIKNTATNQTYTLSLLPQDLFLSNGNYQAWFVLESTVVSSCPTQSDPAQVLLKWTTESNSQIKTIGGLRVKSISDYKNSTLTTKRNFNYDGNDGLTSGRVINVPEYSRFLENYSWSSQTGSPVFYIRYVNSYTPLFTTQGSDVGYGKVTISHENTATGKEEFYYTTVDDYPDSYNGVHYNNTALDYFNYLGKKYPHYPLPQTDSKDYLRGVIKKNIKFKKQGDNYIEVYEKKYYYDTLNYSKGDISIDNHIENAASTVRGVKTHKEGSDLSFTFYNIYTGYNLPSKTIEKQFNSSGNLIQTNIKNYDKDSYGIANYYIPTVNEMIDSKGSVQKSITTYVFNEAGKTTAENNLLIKKAPYIALQVDAYKDAAKLSSQYTVYNHTKWPSLNLPESVKISKGSNALENRVIYHDYDHKGNPVEVSKSNGTHIIYVWGYNEQYPIAKIENATFTGLATNIQTAINSAVTASNNDIDTPTEDNLRTALNNLRGLFPNAMVSTYTYDPLIGVTSVTDPKGYTIYYEYDAFNRLKQVKDKDGHILSENEYNYKN
ncbi:RHS repeat domain-containing protein [Wocania ichthyoenteri]|uniref:RHS repeat domain-containing protein n=1 Tax=Wocania ichthyoenteri TaxID=1230531 RepID=UPI00053E8F7E|nr:RHS repeat domain-containing protein [Wocania ichthyoenteri]